jgi:hypothetical protein
LSRACFWFNHGGTRAPFKKSLEILAGYLRRCRVKKKGERETERERQRERQRERERGWEDGREK